jgi:hypothetical protein
MFNGFVAKLSNYNFCLNLIKVKHIGGGVN